MRKSNDVVYFTRTSFCMFYIVSSTIVGCVVLVCERYIFPYFH